MFKKIGQQSLREKNFGEVAALDTQLKAQLAALQPGRSASPGALYDVMAYGAAGDRATVDTAAARRAAAAVPSLPHSHPPIGRMAVGR